MKLLPFISGVGLAAAAACNASYDYVVIGAGPGGGTLAANLAREGYSVFLIEAGDNTGDSLLQSIPAWANMNVENPGMGWGFFVSHYLNETQEYRDRYYSYRMPNGSLYTGLDPPEGAEPLGIYYPRGSTVGGSMVANAMNFMMPPDSNWEYIAELTGDDAWRPEEMRRYFEELERAVYLDPASNPDHGYEGYITANQNNITYVTGRPGVTRVVRNALSEIEGVHNATEEEIVRLMQRDVNSADPARFEREGVFQTVLNIDENRRRSSPYNYIAETLAAKAEDGSPLYPLTLSTHSLASKVLFDTTKDRPRAIGVEYLVGTQLYEADHAYDESAEAEVRTVTAKKEVIVAGGAFNTPQILKLSGVGPQAELEEHGIPVLVDLPSVGEYLRDNYEAGIHVNAAIPWENNPMAGCLFNPNGTAEEDPCLAQWLDGYGPYGQGSAPIFMILRSSEASTADSDTIVFGGASTVFDGHFPGFSRARWPPESFFFAIVDMQSGEQNGYVRLRSADPRHQPEIHLDFYPEGEGGDTDIRTLADGTRRLLDILQMTGEPYLPLEVVSPPSDVSLEQSIRDHSWSHHVTSSCRMGPRDDGDYCVDSKFRVNGVDRLRVVDGSIFPISPGGFPGSSTATISRKAFYDIIAAAKED